MKNSLPMFGTCADMPMLTFSQVSQTGAFDTFRSPDEVYPSGGLFAMMQT
jgi:hypothetical protein